MESHYIYPFKYHLNKTVGKEFYKNFNVVTLTMQKTPLGVSFKLEPHPHYWSPFGV